MDLIEFLLARIAEDKAVDLHAEHCASRDRGGFPCDCWVPAQRAAECEAKREIIRAYQLRAEQGSQPGGEVFGYHATGLGIAIRHLATAHADHAGYRQEWRP